MDATAPEATGAEVAALVSASVEVVVAPHPTVSVPTLTHTSRLHPRRNTHHASPDRTDGSLTEVAGPALPSRTPSHRAARRPSTRLARSKNVQGTPTSTKPSRVAPKPQTPTAATGARASNQQHHNNPSHLGDPSDIITRTA